ncbi:hypothetical protein D6C78_05799, partial [Aureobasidium pullulans]
PTSATLNYLLGEPPIDLTNDKIRSSIQRELDSPVLDKLYPNLWLVGRQASDNIDPLHRQRIKGRSVVPSEDSGPHMIWTENTIFVKPMPLCLLNHNFWTRYLAEPPVGGKSKSVTQDSRLSSRSIVTGFLRLYALLIRHRCGYEIAKTGLLIPSDFDWIQWSRFTHNFRSLDDEKVAKKYHYGQLRLSRLKWAVPSKESNLVVLRATLLVYYAIRGGCSGATAPPVRTLWRRRSDHHKPGVLDILVDRHTTLMLEPDVASRRPPKHFNLAACVRNFFQKEENGNPD